jgi:hypothetical protein
LFLSLPLTTTTYLTTVGPEPQTISIPVTVGGKPIFKAGEELNDSKGYGCYTKFTLRDSSARALFVKHFYMIE